MIRLRHFWFSPFSISPCGALLAQTWEPVVSAQPVLRRADGQTTDAQQREHEAGGDGHLRSERSSTTLPPPTEAPPQKTPGAPGSDQEPTRRPKRLWVTIGALLILAFIVWIAVKAWHKPAQTATGGNQRGGQAISVVAAKAHTGNISVYFTGLGNVTPVNTVTVRTRVDGQLMRVGFREGQMVRQGELLAEIDDRPYRVQLTQAEGQQLKDEAALQNARTDLQRYQDLIKRNAVAQQVLATQQATVLQDEAAVKADQGLVDSAKLNIAYCHIAAPVSGRIGLRLVDPGNMVHAADTNGLLVITQMQPISVIFTLAEDQLPPVLQRFGRGEKLPVDALDRALTTTLATGQLTTVDNQIDPTTGTLRLRATFDNRNSALFPNEFVNARLRVEEKHNVVLVPSAAVQRNQQNTFVYVVNSDRTVALRNVTVGAVQDDQTEITSGLAAGETVVTAGVDKLQQGTKVTAQLAGGERRQK